MVAEELGGAEERDQLRRPPPLRVDEEVRPHKDQPFYHLLAENSDSEYVAYVSEQNLLPDDSGEPIRHSQVAEIFVKDKSGGYRPRNPSLN